MSDVIVIAGGTGLTTRFLAASSEYWYAQTFQAPENFVPSDLGLQFVTWHGSHTGTLDITFYNTDDDDRPTGFELFSVSYNMDFTGVAAPTYHNPIIDLDTGYAFVQGVMYVYVVKITVALRTSTVFTLMGLPSYVEVPGEMLQSEDAGVTWGTTITRTFSSDAPLDMKFTIWGDIVPAGSTPPSDLIAYPPTRPDAYDPDLIWQPGEWTDPSTYVPGEWGAGYVATGGGRWGQNLVVAGDNSVWYEPHEGVT